MSETLFYPITQLTVFSPKNEKNKNKKMWQHFNSRVKNVTEYLKMLNSLATFTQHLYPKCSTRLLLLLIEPWPAHTADSEPPRGVLL